MSEGKMNIGSAEGDQVLELDINRKCKILLRYS